MKPLSKAQIKAIKNIIARNKKTDQRWHSAFGLQCSLTTLEVLHKRGNLERRSTLGSYSFPRNNIHFKLRYKAFLHIRELKSRRIVSSIGVSNTQSHYIERVMLGIMRNKSDDYFIDDFEIDLFNEETPK